MIETLWIYGKKNVWQHARIIVATFHPYLSGVMAACLMMYSGFLVKPFILAGFFVPYDTVVFGFTATAIALSIAIPSEKFIRFLSEEKGHSTAFRDFLFVLVWNGTIHIVSFILFIPFIFIGETQVIIFDGHYSVAFVYLFLVLWLQFYSCFQFLVTTINVFHLAMSMRPIVGKLEPL